MVTLCLARERATLRLHSFHSHRLRLTKHIVRKPHLIRSAKRPYATTRKPSAFLAMSAPSFVPYLNESLNHWLQATTKSLRALVPSRCSAASEPKHWARRILVFQKERAY